MSVTTKVDTVKLDYFTIPVQVAFYDLDNDHWVGGIGYKDEIICCECGGVIELSDLYDEEILAVEPNPVRVLGDWVSLSDYMF